MWIDLHECSQTILLQAADILFHASKKITDASWTTMESAEQEVKECINPAYMCIGWMEESQLLAWAGLRPMYGDITWELHPIMVRLDKQRQGIGSSLLQRLESMAFKKGILNIVLGTDDELGLTNLKRIDLYKVGVDVAMRNLTNVSGHPFTFYQRNGYTVIGIIPDANGIGKPDIWMGKRITG